jgi:hypothetical protein
MHIFAASTFNLLGTLVAAAILSGLGIAPSAEAQTGIVVNDVELSSETVQALQQIYPVEIAPGRYWYDRVSGAWGLDGEPVAGQMLAGLELGGPLREDASRGDAGVFINGRQITLGEKAFLEQLCQTQVVPGRYWILFNGLGGFEGGPVSFNLRQCPGFAQSTGTSGSMSRTYCDAGGNCTSTGVLGYISTTP